MIPRWAIISSLTVWEVPRPKSSKIAVQAGMEKRDSLSRWILDAVEVREEGAEPHDRDDADLHAVLGHEGDRRRVERSRPLSRQTAHSRASYGGCKLMFSFNMFPLLSLSYLFSPTSS